MHGLEGDFCLFFPGCHGLAHVSLLFSAAGKYGNPREFPIRPDKVTCFDNPGNDVAQERSEFAVAFEKCVSLLTHDTSSALSEMFDLTAQRLVRFAMTITTNQADAEDALQGAFSRIAAKPRLLAKADAPWPYLIRTVRNECLRVLQKKRHTTVEDPDSETKDPDPESVFIHEETADQVRRVLQSLPRAQYEVVILKHWEELTFAEIAEALGLSQNTVASRYRYAMEKLQRSLESLVRN